MAQPSKKPWTKPGLRHFEKAQDLSAHYICKATDAEREKLAEMLEQMQSSRRTRAPMASCARRHRIENLSGGLRALQTVCSGSVLSTKTLRVV